MVTTVEGVVTRIWERMYSALLDFEGTENEDKAARKKMDMIEKWQISRREVWTA